MSDTAAILEEKLQAALDAHISIKLKAFGERIKLKQLLQDRYGLLMRAEANQEVLTSLNDEIAALQTADDIASVVQLELLRDKLISEVEAARKELAILGEEIDEAVKKTAELDAEQSRERRALTLARQAHKTVCTSENSLGMQAEHELSDDWLEDPEEYMTDDPEREGWWIYESLGVKDGKK